MATIWGKNFGPLGTPVAVFVGNTSCYNANVTIDHVQIQCFPPPGVGKNNLLTVLVPASGSKSQAVTSSVFTYNRPIVSQVTKPMTCGANITITGNNFGPTDTTLVVTVDGKTCQNPRVTVANSKILCFAPEGAGTHRELIIQAPGGGSHSQISEAFYFSYRSPVITSGYNYQENATIFGRNFGPIGTYVTANIDGKPCSNAHVTSPHTAIMCTLPTPLGTGSNKTVNVSICAPNSTYCTIGSFNVFSFNAIKITECTKASTSGGEYINITGSGFGFYGSVVKVIINMDDECTNATVLQEHTMIQCIAPPGAGNNLNITVIVENLSTSEMFFSYKAPIISSISSCNTTGCDVTITGFNFGPIGTLINVSSKTGICGNASVTVPHTEIRCKMPAGTGASIATIVSVIENGLQESQPANFSYQAPAVTSASKASTTGLNETVISGYNFGNDASLISITIGQSECSTPRLLEDHNLVACYPPEGAGVGISLTIKVSPPLVCPGCRALSSPDTKAFSYNEPQLISATPVATYKHSLTSIQGNNFGPSKQTTVTVKIGGFLCTDPQVISHTEIICFPPFGAGGNLAMEVWLEVEDISSNASYASADIFSYEPPTVYYSASASTAGGLATFFGTNFGPSATPIGVLVGEESCSGASLFVEHFQIICDVPAGSGANVPVTILVPYSNDTHMQSITVLLFNYDKPLVYNATSANTDCTTTDGTSRINITGTNFGLNDSSISVQIGGSSCSNVTVVIPHQVISCIPPAGVGTNVWIDVSVGPRAGVEGTELSARAQVFSYNPPILDLFSDVPTCGVASALITGRNFGPDNSNSILYYIDDANPLSANWKSQTSLTIAIPPGINKNHSLQVQVKNQLSQIVFFNYQAPSIVNATPTSTEGEKVSSTTKIVGLNFGAPGTNITVEIAGQLCYYPTISIPHFQITCVAPSGSGIGKNITVRVGEQMTTAAIFSFQGPILYNTTSASTDGSIPTTILGTNFGPAGTPVIVSIGSRVSSMHTCKNATVTVPHTQITCYPPPGTGAHLLMAVSVAGQNVTKAIFSYQAPSIIYVTPSDTDPQGPIEIDGTNFGDVNTPVNVTIRQLDLHLTQCSDAKVTINHRQITCTPPPGIGKNLSLTVTIDPASPFAQVASTELFSYNAPKILYATRVDTQGNLTYISGMNFGPVNTSLYVSIGGDICRFPFITVPHRQICCLAPSGAGSHIVIQVFVSPDNPMATQQGTNDSFSYNEPEIWSATPTSTDGFSKTTIFGKNFGPSYLRVEVLINGSACTGATITVPHEQISCFPPEGVGGRPYAVQVITPSTSKNQSVTQFVFTYLSPVIFWSTPTDTTGENVTTISGTGFGPLGTNIAVYIGGQSCNKARVVSPHSQITCYPPAGYGSQKSLVVVVPANSDGSQNASAFFSYNLPLVISATSSPTDGSIPTVITGYNFGPDVTAIDVTISGAECTNISLLVPHKQLSCYPPAGAGADNVVQVQIPEKSPQVGYASVFSYQRPTISSVGMCATSGCTTLLTGANFGPGGFWYTIWSRVNENTVNYTASATWFNQTAIFVSLPRGVGRNHDIRVTVAFQISSVFYFSYDAPVVVSATPVSTSGLQQTTLSGSNFGAVGTPIMVEIDGIPCDNASVTLSDSLITCTPRPGSGGKKNVSVWVPAGTNSQNITAVGAFSYLVPTVSSVSSVPKTGGTTTIKGDNFGFNASLIIIFVGDLECTDVKLQDPHHTVSCHAPPGTHPVALIVQVDGQNSLGSVELTYKESSPGKSNVNLIVGCTFGGVGLLCIAGAFIALAICFRSKRNHESEIIMTQLVGFEDNEESFDASSSEYFDLADSSIQIVPEEVTFGLKGHLADVDSEVGEEITFRNTSKKALSFKLFPPKLSGRLRMTFNPNEFTLSHGTEITVNVTVAVLCTCKLSGNITVAMCTGRHFADGPLSHTFIPVRLESKLSTKLDPEEVSLFTPPIGEGSFGTVYRAQWRGQEVAVKVLKNADSSEVQAEFIHEVKLMESFHCPQIIHFVGAVYIKNKKAIVTEFMPIGSLNSAVKAHRLNNKIKVKLLLDCAKGMAFLHKSGVIHRDLKPDNVLVSSLDPSCPVCAKLSDFGTTRDVQNAKEAAKMTTAIGTPAYMSPEILTDNSYSGSTDVYSFALLMYSLFCEQEPYTSGDFSSAWRIVEFVTAGKRLPIPNTVLKPISALIEACWAQQPTDRPSFDEIATTLEGILGSL
ncbi:protein serine/threonine kinase [Pelomyxa schiedti]|nr:protein serine/threonine kinase [Pelomyxa schiedti]